jgi:hypothetical protein
MWLRSRGEYYGPDGDLKLVIKVRQRRRKVGQLI